jgi:uncharacterized protein
MWSDLGTAAALMLILEGILPFLNPAGVRRMLAAVQVLGDRELRLAGFVSMMSGLGMLYLLH